MGRLLCTLLALASGVLALRPASAGGGPERTVVVVNADSPLSLQVAHTYARRRSIPASHLVYLPGVPSLKVVDLPTFRERLWGPVKRTLEERGLLESTDLVAWSVDLPFAVDVGAEAQAKKVEALPHVPFRAALTGLTYLWREVEAEEPARYLHLHANRAFQPDPNTQGGGPGGRPLTPAEATHARAAAAAIQAKDYTAARDAYLQLTKLAPDLMGAWYDLACCHARLGDAEAALGALTQAVEKGWSDSAHTLADADLETLRPLPAFDALLERMLARKPAVGALASRALSAAADGHLPSVMLGVTGEWGNSVPEVLSCLERGAASDGTAPDGAVYLLANDDVRADTRERFFAHTVGLLEGLGRRAQVLTKGQDGQDGVVPKGKADVIGLMMGVAGFNWKDSGSTLLPGAIAEHLTSFGADFTHGGQTKLSELIRAGSAGSSGTVAEPLALWQKFPLPTVHAHYARGCSLAEAYYLSLAGPWQTLVVGDPLARPFARFAVPTLALPAGGQALQGTVALTAGGLPAEGAVEVWVDGRLRSTAKVGEALTWDTTVEDDGVHEVRLVHVAADAVATRSFARSEVAVSNAGRSVTLLGPKAAPTYGAMVALTGKAPGATEAEVLLGAHVLARVAVKGGAFKVEVDTLTLGPSPVALVARALRADGPAARSLPLEVAPAAASAPTGKPKKPPAKGKEKGKEPAAAPAGDAGLRLTVIDAGKKAHTGVLPSLTDAALANALTALKVPQPTRIELTGEIEVPEPGFYRLALATAGKVEVQWAGQRALESTDASPTRLAFAGAWLPAGWSSISITLEPAGPPRLDALLGGHIVSTPTLRLRAP